MTSRAGKTSRRGTPAEASRAGTDLAPVVGANLRRLRGERRWTLEQLASASGVSRAMLGQIELGRSAPTINVLWKIARALDVTFSALISAREAGGTVVLRASEARRMSSHDGGFVSRPLFPIDAPRRVELYELRVAPGKTERGEPHPPGTTENLVVASGELEIAVGAERHHLGTGDAILFQADGPHAYGNPGTRAAVAYLVMTYAEGLA
jgi:transcriptional regulator with XRE-family HTH domain